MRIDRLTSKLQLALSDAQSLAVGHDHPAIEPVHLVLALLDQQGGSIKPLLMQVGFDVAALRQGLTRELDHLPKIQNPTGDVNLSQDLARLLNQADRLAQQKGDQFISSELVLLAAMDDPMADRDDAQLLPVPDDPVEEHGKHGPVLPAVPTTARYGLVDHPPAAEVNHVEPRLCSDALDLAAIAQRETVRRCIQGEHRELDARRSGVEDEDAVRHGLRRHHAPMRARCTTANRATNRSVS